MWLTLAIKNWKIIALAVVSLALIGAGMWFRGVLAENKELSQTVKAQKEALKEINAEVERMNRQDALDQSLFEQIEAQKIIQEADNRKQAAALKKLRKELDDAANRCFDMVLPPAYLDGLPKDGN